MTETTPEYEAGAAADTTPAERQIESRASGFTPIFDVVVHDVGLTGAMVFGKMWRYCQMETGLCYASKERLAGESNMGTRTFVRWAKRLVEAGYLQDMTPDRRNAPHVYRDTGKVRMILKLEAVAGMPERQTGYATVADLGLPEWQDKIQDKTQSKKPTTVIVAENLSILQEFGVQPNDKTLAIASLPHVTPEVIRAVADRLRTDRKTRNLAGRLLDALERGDTSPGRGQHTEAELEAARAEALAEEPIDVDTYL